MVNQGYMRSGKYTLSVNVPVELYNRMLARKLRTGETLALMYNRGITMYLDSMPETKTDTTDPQRKNA